MQPKIQYRDLSGVLLLNKDLGVSSNRALQQVRRLFKAAKAGHTGSLDPLATGVLPICFGEATKYSSYLLDSDKTYHVTAKLGITTTTDDCEGEITANNPVPNFTAAEIISVANTFLGTTQQVPTMYSALKFNGQPLYKLARQGISVTRAARDITISRFELLSQSATELKFAVSCSKGTYIRTLIADFGIKLGCGAHVAALERVTAGPFQLEQCYNYEQLLALDHANSNLDLILLPVSCLLQQLPTITVQDADAIYLRNGRSVATPSGVTVGTFSLVTIAQEFIGIADALNDGTLVPRRMMRNYS